MENCEKRYTYLRRIRDQTSSLKTKPTYCVSVNLLFICEYLKRKIEKLDFSCSLLKCITIQSNVSTWFRTHFRNIFYYFYKICFTIQSAFFTYKKYLGYFFGIVLWEIRVFRHKTTIINTLRTFFYWHTPKHWIVCKQNANALFQIENLISFLEFVSKWNIRTHCSKDFRDHSEFLIALKVG